MVTLGIQIDDQTKRPRVPSVSLAGNGLGRLPSPEPTPNGRGVALFVEVWT